ncbi:MAG TPA: hypothetical protein ENI59_00140 [Euryarchaeota archaeon]|nr:hypothetical protein [Euryarchaeota archaeon]
MLEIAERRFKAIFWIFVVITIIFISSFIYLSYAPQKLNVKIEKVIITRQDNYVNVDAILQVESESLLRVDIIEGEVRLYREGREVTQYWLNSFGMFPKGTYSEFLTKRLPINNYVIRELPKTGTEIWHVKIRLVYKTPFAVKEFVVENEHDVRVIINLKG